MNSFFKRIENLFQIRRFKSLSPTTKRNLFLIELVLLCLVLLVSYQNCAKGFSLKENQYSSASILENPVTELCSPGAQVACQVENGIGIKTCNTKGDAYGACEISSCHSGFVLQNGACVAGSCIPGAMAPCSAGNGSGVQVCNQQGNGFGTCQITTCKDGFTLKNGACESIPSRKVSVRLGSGCALQNGSVKCWGYSSYGQLGNESRTPVPITSAVTMIASGATDVSVGLFHICAVVNGALKCWGDSRQCQAGPTESSTKRFLTPTTVIASGVTAVSAGYAHTCAIVNGGLQCFGVNDYGQLGNGKKSDSLSEYSILGKSPYSPYDCSISKVFSAGVTDVSAGDTHTCAVVNGAVQCWGGVGPTQDRFSDGIPSVRSLTPVTIVSSGATKVSAGTFSYNGMNHSCAIVNSTLQCWGYNQVGPLGDGTSVSKSAPVTVLSSGVTDVSTGDLFTCAVANGSLKCWGYPLDGRLGIGSSDGLVTNSPQTIISSGVSSVSSGGTSSCAVVNGQLKCWGGGFGLTPADQAWP